jgi:MFS family permease
VVARTADALVVWLCQGIFFIGYCISMLPSNLFILWLGAPNWLAIIIVAWGVIGAATSAVKNHWEFYLLRFLLGLAEGGASARSACWLSVACTVLLKAGVVTPVGGHRVLRV